MRDWTKRELIEEQMRLERMAHHHGMKKYWHNVKRARETADESSTKPCQAIMSTLVPRVADEIVAKCASVSPRRSGIAAPYLRAIRPEIAALITLRVVCDTISTPRTLTSLANAIGERIEDEARFTAIDRDILRKIMLSVKHKSDYAHKHIAATKYANNDYNDGWADWSRAAEDGTKIRIHVGIFCLDALLAVTNLVTLVTVRSGSKTTNKIIPTQEALKWLRQQHSELLELYPEHEPMICPPKPWTDFRTGGYLTNHIPQLSFVRTHWKQHRDLLRQPETVAQMGQVYAAVNAIQATAWRINPTVLATLRHYYDNHIAAAGLPYREEIEPPRCPLCGAAIEPGVPHPCFDRDPKALERWKKLKKRWHETLAANRSRAELIGRTLATAEKFADYPAIYFPHNCDFRGRIYAIPENLHPQGSDFAKGLLEYAEGKTIDTHEALLWLKIAGANHSAEGKIDKASFATRAAWVDAHEQEIRAIAADPLANTQWTKADEPWQYLAWCCDYAAYLADPENYKSHAVVAMDGSCNGLQHYSAMLRDPDGARAVNLEPSDKPSDIYQIVADKVIAKLKTIINNPAATAQDKDTATRWLAVGINRSTTKRSVMVVPYSGTQLACRKYIQEHLEEKIDKQVAQALADNIGSGATYMEIDQAVRAAFPFVTDRSETDIDTFKASTWLAKHVWAAIGETITSAKTAMTSLQQLAKAATAANLPIQWTTPSGFTVRQSYFDTKITRLRTKLGDTEIRLQFNQETAALSPSEQANAIAPNFVHSLDAAALVKTVNRCAAEAITAFAMVHDSYATHAADAPRMAQILREEFIHLYTDQDPLAELWQNTNKQITEKGEYSLSPLPAKKFFDLEKVSDSLYFFA